jgi:hypothetical protein
VPPHLPWVASLAALDRRVLPRLADAVDRVPRPQAGIRPGLVVGADARRVLGGIALVLMLSALALVLVGR